MTRRIFLRVTVGYRFDVGHIPSDTDIPQVIMNESFQENCLASSNLPQNTVRKRRNYLAHIPYNSSAREIQIQVINCVIIDSIDFSSSQVFDLIRLAMRSKLFPSGCKSKYSTVDPNLPVPLDSGMVLSRP